MVCATVADMKKLIANAKDDDVLVFQIYSEDQPEVLRFSSDIADASTLTADHKSGQQTSDGDRNVIRIKLALDLEPCD